MIEEYQQCVSTATDRAHTRNIIGASAPPPHNRQSIGTVGSSKVEAYSERLIADVN